MEWSTAGALRLGSLCSLASRALGSARNSVRAKAAGADARGAMHSAIVDAHRL